jgi:hypothetical protein
MSSSLRLCVLYSERPAGIMVSGKVSLIGQEQGLRARIMKLAYIRDVGIGTVLVYTVPIMLYTL